MNILTRVLPVILCLLPTSVGLAQDLPLRDASPRGRFLDLRLQQQRSESNIAENRVTRQAEIARLEGRLLDLESRIDRISTSPATHSLVLLEIFDRLYNQPQTDAGNELAKPNSEPSIALEPQDDKAAKADASTESASSAASVRRGELVDLILDDYVMGLQIERARAQVDRLKTSDELQAIEQMQARGLASKPQLELLRLKHQEAQLRVSRVDKLLSGLNKIVPGISTAKTSSAN